MSSPSRQVSSRTRRRDESGVAVPSPVVLLSVAAVIAAGGAFALTSGNASDEVKVPIASPETVAPTPSATPTATPSATPTKKPKPKPKINRGKVYVEVFNNSGITGLAGRTAAKITAAGWQVVGSDNWVGNIPADTVYYPTRLKAEGKQLALDLGIDRVKVAVEPMKGDRLTVILTG
ncbi:LytR C-terminal domain-containing protein [Nocardioides yefusunii]|uniref:LytR C-terminal domain-containing protein n=1 Tax=Nocardioides yefusunii TaxID=2500546 RepID=A0ABW1R0V6_9ACTN|nr:LytR C-terminal domain-containing protein [Nocardioides yefusunii]